MTRDLHLDQHLQQALSSLIEGQTDQCWVSVVIDPMLTADSFSAESEIQALLKAGQLERHVWPISHVDLPPDERPYLLSTQKPAVAERVLPPSLQWAWAERSGAHPQAATGRSVAGWLLHEAPPRQLTKALAKAGTIQKPDGSPWVLRYWDPRVTEHLERAWPEWHQCFAPILARWYHWHIDGTWLPWARQPLPARPHTDDRPLRAAPPIWQALQRIASINHVLAWMPQWQIPIQAQTTHLIDQWLRQAQAQGYTNTQDQVSYVTACLQCHPDFHVTARLQQVLRSSPRDHSSTSLSAALLSLSDDDWLLMAQQARALAADHSSQLTPRDKL